MELKKVDLKYKHTAGGLKIPKVEGNGFGIYASEEVIIAPSESKYVKTNTIIDVPEGYLLMILPALSVAENTTLRFANSVGYVANGDKEEIKLLMENVTPLSIRKNVAPEYTLLSGEHVVQDYSKGYLPVGTIVVQRGDCIGRAFLTKIEGMTLSRTTRKVQGQDNEKEEE